MKKHQLFAVYAPTVSYNDEWHYYSVGAVFVVKGAPEKVEALFQEYKALFMQDLRAQKVEFEDGPLEEQEPYLFRYTSIDTTASSFKEISRVLCTLHDTVLPVVNIED